MSLGLAQSASSCTSPRVNHLAALSGWTDAALVVICGVCSALWPFQTFVLAYVILGPLHYLTEISWLQHHAAFGHRSLDAVVLAAIGAIFFLGERLLHGAVRPYFFMSTIAGAMGWAWAAAFSSTYLIRTLAFALSAGAGVLVTNVPVLFLLIAVLVPTVLHVLWLTLSLLIADAVAQQRGLHSIATLMAYVGIIFGILIGGVWSDAPPGRWALDWFGYVGKGGASYGFFYVNYQILDILGFHSFAGDKDDAWVRNTLTYVFRSTEARALMGAIAFCYSYHYAHWFSNAQKIGWNQMSRIRSYGIAACWAIVVGVFVLNVRLGLLILFSMSLIHVLMELPLNWIMANDAVASLVRRSRRDYH